MNEFRPEIAPLANAETHADRAKALIMMSDSALMTCEFAIRNQLRARGFQAGLNYLDAALVVLRSPRDAGGSLPPQALLDVVGPWTALRALAKGEAAQ